MNPFVYDRPIPAEMVIGRERDATDLLDSVENGVNASLRAPRRFGKTSLIAKVLADVDRTLGMATVAVDLYGILTRHDLAARIERAYRSLRGPLARTVGELTANITLRFGPLGIGAGGQARDAPVEGRLLDLLDLPLRVLDRTGRQTVVAFDEFQAIADLPGADGLMRSVIQHHGRAATYIFAGSEPSLLSMLFDDRSRPFYGQARPFRLDRLRPDETIPAIRARFEATNRSIELDTLTALAVAGDGHPQRTMLLANRLWEATRPGREAGPAEWDRARGAAVAQLATEFEAQWAQMKANERRVVAALASGLSPISARDGSQVGLKQPSSAQRAIDALITRTVVERPPAGGLRIIDPLLALWVAELRAA